MFSKKYLLLLTVSLLFLACSSSDETQNQKERNMVQKINKADLPKKIKILFVTQPHCPSCDQLETTMKAQAPQQLIQNYFKIETIFLGKKLPDGLIPPNGTPTVYFLGYHDEALMEPMIGEKSEEALMMFLEDALLEFKNLYGVDLVKQKGENNDTNQSKKGKTVHESISTLNTLLLCQRGELQTA